MAFHQELAVAIEAAERAGQIIRTEYDLFTPIPDAPADISTHVDKASQEAILKHIRAAFPDDGLCAEEVTATKALGRQAADRVWVVDPIDGTRGFAKKNGEFSVMIALRAAGKPVVGVVLEPVAGRMTFAAAGGGCFVKSGDGPPAPCRVTTRTTLPEATLVQSRSKPGYATYPAKLLKPAKVIETYSAGVKLAMVARGEADLYVNTYSNFSDWDICAGDILVIEAGGTVTDLSGYPVRYGADGGAVYPIAAITDEGSPWGSPS
jgi:3'(2'), 5'-bisphosphate nucleotidase